MPPEAVDDGGVVDERIRAAESVCRRRRERESVLG
jgi:hypothetical protein